MLFISTWESSRTYSKPTYVMYNGMPCLVSPGINNKPIELPEGDIIGKQIADLQKQKEELLAALKAFSDPSYIHCSCVECQKKRNNAMAIISRIDHA